MPMMSIQTVKQAESLIQERRRVVAAKWDHVAAKADFRLGNFSGHEPADEQLQSAIEEFRNRKLAAIDGQLRELGVDPSEQDDTA